MDDAAVRAECDGGLAVVCSLLDAATYAGGEAESRAGDVEWIGPRAVAHDAVLTWASEAFDVVPFPMFTLFSSAEALRSMLHERRASLVGTLSRVRDAHEYALRIFQVGGEAESEALSRMSPALAELERRVAAASPGQRYLLERKLEWVRRDELVIAGSAVASEVYQTLSTHSAAAVRDALPAPAAGGGRERERESTGGSVGREEGHAVLDASFLVRRDAVPGFSAAVGALARRHEACGFRFEFTGPWPPYHFARANE